MLSIKFGQVFGKQLISDREIKKGTMFHKIEEYKILSKPNYQSFQVSAHEHFWEVNIAHINHSCDPNITINVESMELYAIRDIKAYDVITFFYPSTEWELDRPFRCKCGANNCIKFIRGAKYLSSEILDNYFVNPHIRLMRYRNLVDEPHDTENVMSCLML